MRFRYFDPLEQTVVEGDVGEIGATFDYFGARTQVPGHYAVPLAAAVSAAGSSLAGTGPGLPFAMD